MLLGREFMPPFRNQHGYSRGDMLAGMTDF